MGVARSPVTPVPVVTSMMVSGAGADVRLDLTGHQFTPSLTAWFGAQPAKTLYRFATSCCVKS